MNEDHKLTPELTEAVDALAENLLAAEPFLALEGTYLRLQEDAQARDLQQRFRQAEATLRQRQANRTMTQADMAAYRTLNAEAQANELIAGYSQRNRPSPPVCAMLTATSANTWGWISPPWPSVRDVAEMGSVIPPIECLAQPAARACRSL